MFAVRGRRHPVFEEAIAVLLAAIDRFGWSDNGRGDAFCRSIRSDPVDALGGHRLPAAVAEHAGLRRHPEQSAVAVDGTIPQGPRVRLLGTAAGLNNLTGWSSQ
jgi:hypothetical protein